MLLFASRTPLPWSAKLASPSAMSISPLPRAAALEVIRNAADAIAATKTGPRDANALARALMTACASAGIAPEELDAAVAADPELYRLEQEALKDAMTGQPDPGPYAAISRESPSGQAGDTSKSRTSPEPDPALSSWDRAERRKT